MKKISDFDSDNFIVGTFQQDDDNDKDFKKYQVKVEFIKKFPSLKEAQECEKLVFELLEWIQDHNEGFKKMLKVDNE